MPLGYWIRRPDVARVLAVRPRERDRPCWWTTKSPGTYVVIGVVAVVVCEAAAVTFGDGIMLMEGKLLVVELVLFTGRV